MVDYSNLLGSIHLKVQQLTADYLTLEASRHAFRDGFDKSVVHESTGVYVTSSTDGYFPNQTGAAYRFSALIGELLRLEKNQQKSVLKTVDEAFHAAVWEGFDNPTNPNGRKKKKNFRDLRRDASVEDFNNLLADIYDDASQLFQQAQQAKDEIRVQIFGAMFAAAAVASDTEAPPYNFDFGTQNGYVENIKNAVEVLKKKIR
mmetsp:Transcript_7306/g.8381  ORF Transcript_7306/g.8381 Transcript_7306/m.8381 type:complete len:203 (-) Transcript_7306:69-677(-)|eukprot:CAMPEP_0184019336 /NCGR_PEP_ID=MMETSP0954-20121128/8691_1 /TAXON_ID=627963 /ORGANISM="Aplanochytrium sp, Strain PBS07" /LENGTH=202 /DNA_ID=CAMNT_0026300983 /DNA_START=179 /DNA_END=787 /DNA_ORIENTATION=+